MRLFLELMAFLFPVFVFCCILLLLDDVELLQTFQHKSIPIFVMSDARVEA